MDRDGPADPMALLTPAAFWVPERFVESAWVTHAPFAFWLIESHRPRSLVELGTHSGFSYLVFCQAVDRLSTGTRCHAVDHWMGDEHAGFYDEEVYEQLRRYHDERYSSFSKLLRTTFSEAARHFADGSVDLLHIDGAHRIEDVQEDFDTWLPKMSDRGVILFHDINVHEDDFGVHALWDDIKVSYPHFEFDHGHGLGVLGCGPGAEKTLGPLFDLNADDRAAATLRRVFYRLGEALVDRIALDEAAVVGATLHAELAERRAELTERRAELTERRAELTEAVDTIATLQAGLAESGDTIASLQADVARTSAQVDELRESTSWRVTAPARAITRRLRRVFRR